MRRAWIMSESQSERAPTPGGSRERTAMVARPISQRLKGRVAAVRKSSSLKKPFSSKESMINSAIFRIVTGNESKAS